MQHFIFQRIFFGLLQFAPLVRLQFGDFGFQRLFDDRRGQDFFLFTGADNNLTVRSVRQRITL